jgi:glycosyltransferase involved in cell wall biosynthesis
VDEVLLVDGKSIDGTPEVAKNILPTIVILTQSGKGKGDALKYGFKRRLSLYHISMIVMAVIL